MSKPSCSVDFIYFDLGNVILNFDHGRALAALSQLTGIEPSTFQATIFDSGLQIEYETGRISSDEFAATIAKQAGADLIADDVLRACSDIFSLNAPIVSLIANLKASDVRLGVLSNTCEAHWRYVTASRNFTVLREFFDLESAVLSFEESSMKPDAKIYNNAIERAGVAPERIFFTDDRPENVKGALDCGIDAVAFTGVPDLVRVLSSRGLPTRFL